jgi:hypothetical protein
MSLGLIFLILLGFWFLSQFVTLSIPSGINKSKTKTKLNISKSYPDIVNEIQFLSTSSKVFKWSKIWVNNVFGKTAKTIADSNLGYIRASYISSIPEISSFHTYSVEITIKKDKLVFAIRDIYYDSFSYSNEYELDEHVNKYFQYLKLRFLNFMQSNCFSEEFSEFSQKNVPSADLISFYRNLLGFRINFTRNELKSAYHEAVAKFHPDKYTTTEARNMENAEILMKQINEAYEVLKKITVETQK